MFRVDGDGANTAFKGEPGGHRYQRVPPTEKRGRVQTSTVTVAVLPEPTKREFVLEESDLDEQFTRGSGSGGQHKNKVSTAVRLTHKPSGLQVRVDGGRSQSTNREAARALLSARLAAATESSRLGGRRDKRREQIGSGARGDKVRTISVPRNSVVDHRTGKRSAYKEYARGGLRKLR